MWNRRSSKNLIGNHINIFNGDWYALDASIGGNSDSFYEYLLKSSLLFGNQFQGEMFISLYTSAITYLRRHPWYISTDMNNANSFLPYFESLQAFWPGLQVPFFFVLLLCFHPINRPSLH